MQMLTLLSLFVLLSTARSNVIKESEAYQAIEDPYEYTSPYELIDIGINDLFAAHPSLSATSEDDLIMFKKEFMNLLADKPEVQDEVFGGGFVSKYPVVFGKMKELRKIASNEFDELPDEEQRFAESPTGYMLHKLGIQSALSVIAKKKAEYKERRLTKEQIKQEIDQRQLDIFHSWHTDEEFQDVTRDITDEL